MPKPTTLATGQITLSDSLTVELHEPLDMPPVILITWPPAPTVTDARRFAAVANAVVTILAEARAALARYQADER
jgi:hypothetical protein